MSRIVIDFLDDVWHHRFMKEIWKDVKGFEGSYQVSNLGRIRSIDRTITHINRWGKMCCFRIPGIIMKKSISAFGYERIQLKDRKYHVHRLILTSFIGINKDKKFTNHKNGIKTDNRLINIEWITASDNLKHAYKNNLAKPTRTIKVVRHSDGKVFESLASAGRDVGVDAKSIWFVCNKVHKTCHGDKYSYYKVGDKK